MIKLVVKAEVPEGGTKDFSYEFDQPVVTMGRLKENDIQLPLSTVSGYHSQILKEDDSYYLLDRGSINGTFLNGQRLQAGEKKLLNDGDVIRIQTFDIYYSSGITMMNIDAGATVQVARQMVMEVLGSWQTNVQEKPRVIVMGGANNGKKIDLVENKALIAGRVADCDVVIDHPSVSRKHAEISLSWSGAFIKDLKSANGVYINDQRVTGSQKLRDRDEIRLGQQTSKAPTILLFSNPAEALLSKIEDMQSTDSTGTTGSKEAPPKGSEEPKPAGEKEEEPAEQKVGEEAGEAKEAGAPEESEAPAIAEAAGEEVVPEKKKSLLVPLVLVAVAVLVLAAAAVGFYYVWGGLEQAGAFTVEPAYGSSGDTITLKSDSFTPDKLNQVSILNQPAKVTQSAAGFLQIVVPEFPGLESPETRTEIVIAGKKAELGRVSFDIILVPHIKSVSPRSGLVGVDVRIQTNIPGSQPTVYFGSTPAAFKSKTDKELIVSVPKPSDLVPAGGLNVPITVKMNDRASNNSVDFVILPNPVTQEETFQLVFAAKPYSHPLGFNEYSIETNAGSLLVMAAKGTFASSRERAEDGARNLNNAVGFFEKSPAAHVTISQEGDHYVLFGEGAAGEDKVALISVYQDDTLGYGKITQHNVELDELASWWQMLLNAYFKVFVQVESPANTGILASGGSVFQQIYDFYAVGNEQGKKYYKKDLFFTLPTDQKDKLLSVSYALPERVLRVDGKWAGSMSNNLYTNLSVQSLELVLTLRQSGQSLSGSADMNWKIIMGGGDKTFQNVAYRKLGTYRVSGSFLKNKSLPLELSFTEKEGRRLDFIGKVEGDILFGKFVIASTGEEGTFNLKLQK